MSALTKVFIVLLVVISLLLSAGVVVFVNRTENFKVENATAKAAADRAKVEMTNAKNEARAQAQYAAEARAARDAAIADGQKAVAAVQDQLATVKASLADAQGNAKILQLSIDNITSAVNASEAARKSQSDILDTTRTANNDLNTKVGQLNQAISDLTNKLEVASRKLSDYQESIAELKAAKESAEKQIVGMGGKVGSTGEIAAGAPPINAVVRSSRLINGIPYATISVGADAQVVKGMKFNVIDSVKGNFLGELTIEQVDERESTGKLEGPGIGDVHTGTEVKTQL